MSFDVSADAYTRFMGRYSEPLAVQFAALADPQPGQRAVDVGCGPGALTSQLVERLGVSAVSAIDPSESFVAATQLRFPGLDVRQGVAERLPFPDDGFDVAMAQLVVHFMSDPVAGLREIGRVTQPGGSVLACVWGHTGTRGPLTWFWRAVQDLDPDAETESNLAGTREGHLAELFEAAGLRDIESSSLTVRATYSSFVDWWEPYTLGVGPAGAYVAGLDDSARDRLQARCAELLPEPPFEVEAQAWCVRALA